jgi:TonB family protein
MLMALARAGFASAAEPAIDGGVSLDAAPAGDGAVDDGGSTEGAAGASVARDVSPPEPLGPATPEYPAAALAARLEGAVTLRLEIDDAGGVTAAEVTRPLGHGFDESARAAVLSLRFRPALRDGKPVRARISYRVLFRLPASPDAGAAAPPASPDGGAAPPPPPPAQPAAPAAPPAAAPAAPPPARGPSPVEVTVRGETAAERLRRSAEAVTVVETTRAKRESADMGEVLARTQGVGVRREGGLGSRARISLNGLTDDQVRFFLDGVPLDLAGYPFGIANVPVNLIERIEIYSGVMPIRFGADALGGGMNLVTNQDLRGTHAAGSYESGSFDTHRLTLTGRHLHAPTGLFVRAGAFFDRARNDYPIDVEVSDPQGQLSPARVHRFHDKYSAGGANLEAGVVDRPWARRLLARAFVTDYVKEYQHNVLMTVPYGEVVFGEALAGGSVRYEHTVGPGVSIDALTGYTFRHGHYLDVARCVYDWFGRCGLARPRPGEVEGRPHDQLSWDHAAYARVNLGWRARPGQTVRLTLSPTAFTRTGDELQQLDPTARDPLSARRALLTVVSGIEHQLDVLGDRLENVAFVKQYVQLLDSEEPRPGNQFRERDRATHRFGVGDGLRYRLGQGVYAKASYEWATRLPRPEEIFGDNAFVSANLELAPEVSHNGNLGVMVEPLRTRAGTFRGMSNVFLRLADDLILLLGDQVKTYRNVYGARSMGVEGSLGWTSPHELLVIDGTFTVQDLRNTSSKGTFGAFDGDRLPNRPYLFATLAARLQRRGVVVPQDQLALYGSSRYVHGFFLGWESLGRRDLKPYVPSQLVHTAGLLYLVRQGRSQLSWAIEVQNLGDERVFDFYGVQRPGRAFYAKATAEF